MRPIIRPALVQAASDGDFEGVRTLLNAGANVNDTDTRGWSALIMAVCNDDFRMAELLVMHGADANIAPHSRNEIPLIIAAYRGNNEIVTLLLNNGAQIDSQNFYYHTALLDAIEKENLQTAKLLIMRGADVNLADNFYRTPLFIAASFGDANFITLLLDNHADVNSKDSYGQTALHAAVAQTSFVSLKTSDISKYLEVIEALLEGGADVSIRNNRNELPIDMASKCSEEVRKKIKALFDKPRKSTKDRP